MTMNMLTIDALAEKARKPRYEIAAVGARLDEIKALLNLGTGPITEYYSDCRVDGRQPHFYSRAAITSRISEFSGRAVSYPSGPLLRFRHVLQMADQFGIPLSKNRLVWAGVKFERQIKGGPPSLPVVRVTPTQTRAEPIEAARYLAAVQIYFSQ